MVWGKCRSLYIALSGEWRFLHTVVLLTARTEILLPSDKRREYLHTVVLLTARTEILLPSDKRREYNFTDFPRNTVRHDMEIVSWRHCTLCSGSGCQLTYTQTQKRLYIVSFASLRRWPEDNWKSTPVADGHGRQGRDESQKTAT